MEKLQTLLWILLGLGFFIWRMVQKAREAMARDQRERPARTRQAPPLPAASFEELLKQMQAKNNPTAPASAPAFPVETTPAGRPLPREAPPVARSLERTERTPRTLEEVPEARSLEVPLHEARRAAQLARASNRPTPDDYWTRQAAAKAKEPVHSAVSDILKNPANLRTAFVLSEILKPKF